MKIYTTDCNYGKDIESVVFSTVWQEILTEYLREFTYMGNSANLGFTVQATYDCLIFQWTGYNDSMANYISESCDRILQMKNENLADIFDQVQHKLL